MGFITELKAQINPLPYPKYDFSGQTVVVTGASSGIGKEAVKHFIRLNAAKVIGTARTLQKCQVMKKEIEAETQSKGIVDFWVLEYGSYSSVLLFASRLSQEPRLDKILLNAGVYTTVFETLEQDESSITINLVSSMLLAVLLVPVLQTMADKFSIQPVLTLTGSRSYQQTKFPERNARNYFEALNNPTTTNMSERYGTSKLLQLMSFLKLGRLCKAYFPGVIVNMTNPGFVKTGLARNLTGLDKIVLTKIIAPAIAWNPEQGSRTLVESVTLGRESHGKFLSEGRIERPHVSKWVEGKEGAVIQERLWIQLSAKLEVIRPGILNIYAIQEME